MAGHAPIGVEALDGLGRHLLHLQAGQSQALRSDPLALVVSLVKAAPQLNSG